METTYNEHQESMKNPEQNAEKPGKTRITGGVVLKGDITSQTDIEVEGMVNGVVYSKGCVDVCGAANIKGKILCSNLNFYGKMDGDIFVRDVLSVKSTAIINGNIQVREINVEKGAQINGIFKMISEAEFDSAVAKFTTKKSSTDNKPEESKPEENKIEDKDTKKSFSLAQDVLRKKFTKD